MVAESEIQEVQSPKGIVARLRKVFNHPGDVLFAFHIGLFLFRIPGVMQKQSLPDLLKKLRYARGPETIDPDVGVARIARLRQPWFRIPQLSSRNTCYVRALTLYRFLNIPGSSIRIHFGVEPSRVPGEHTRGHAWVTVDGRMMEPPNPVLAGCVKELYAYPTSK